MLYSYYRAFYSMLFEREGNKVGGTQKLQKHSSSSVIVIDLAFAELKSTRDEEDS